MKKNLTEQLIKQREEKLAKIKNHKLIKQIGIGVLVFICIVTGLVAFFKEKGVIGKGGFFANKIVSLKKH